MDLYLAGAASRGGTYRDLWFEYKPFFMLESFIYIAKWQIEWSKSPSCLGFMLDSGVFTFAYGKGGFDKINLDQYVDKYIEFIKKNDIEQFFEMDLDAYLPLGKIEQIREKIEKGTGKQCIPVWHMKRGVHSWEKLCDEYDLIAIGTESKTLKHNYIPFCNSLSRGAHSKGCKVHALGFSSLGQMNKVLFDSFDSKTWLMGEIGKHRLYNFADGKMQTGFVRSHLNMTAKEITRHNITNWIDYVNFLRTKKEISYNESLQMF